MAKVLLQMSARSSVYRICQISAIPAAALVAVFALATRGPHELGSAAVFAVLIGATALLRIEAG